MKYNTGPYSTPPRSVFCQHNDHRWDVSHRHSGGSAVSSPRSKWRKHAQMGEAEPKLFIITSSALSVTYIMLSGLLNPVNGLVPVFQMWYIAFINLYFSISIAPLLCHFQPYFIHLSVLPVLPCQLPSSFLFSDFLACDSSGSVRLPERVHQMPRHRLQQECFSKSSGYVGGFDLTPSSCFSCLLFNAFFSLFISF